MKHIIRKVFLDFEKEEKWLNEMAAKGLNFVNYSFARYVFEEGNPMEYIYRIELLESLPKTPQSRSYIEFMEEAGVECVDTYFRWVYFRKKKSDGEFDLYSDYDSRIKHYKRIAALLGSLSALNLFAALYNLIIGLYIGHEKGFYFNVYFSLISWIVFGVLISLYISYKKKIKRMKKRKADLRMSMSDNLRCQAPEIGENVHKDIRLLNIKIN